MPYMTGIYKLCLENHIVLEKNNSYACYLCDNGDILTSESEITSHVFSEEHTINLNKIGKEKIKNDKEKISIISERLRRQLVKQKITCSTSISYLFWCYVCESPIFKLTDTFEHVESSEHKREFHKVCHREEKKIDDSTDLVELNSFMELDFIIYNPHARHSLNCIVCDRKFCTIEDFIYHISKRQHASEIVKRKINHNSQKERSLVNEQNKCKMEEKVEPIFEVLYCESCKVVLNTTIKLQLHIMLHLHEKFPLSSKHDIIILNSYQRMIVLKCLICNEKFEGYRCSLDHIRSENHSLQISKLRNKSEIDIHDSKFDCTQIDPKILEFQPMNNISIISLRHSTVPSVTSKNNTLKSKKKIHNLTLHKNPLSQEYPYQNESNMDIPRLFSCFACQLTFSSTAALFNHYQKAIHKYKQ